MYNVIIIISLAFASPIQKEQAVAIIPKEIEAPKRNPLVAQNSWYAKFF